MNSHEQEQDSAASDIPVSRHSTPKKLVVTFIPNQGDPSPRALAGIVLLQNAARGTITLSSKAVQLIGFILRGNRVCPQHAKWMEMWRMLPEIEGKKPAGPVPLIAWQLWDPRIRHEFLMRHIECADQRGVIDQVDNFLRALPKEEWCEGFFDL